MTVKQQKQGEVSKRLLKKTYEGADSVRICNDYEPFNKAGLQTYISTSVNQMNELFNIEKARVTGDGKTKHEWDIEIKYGGTDTAYITVYDYKEWPSSDSEIFCFHVGAHKESIARFGVNVLEELFEVMKK